MCRRKFALLPYPTTIDIEGHRNGHQHCRNAAEQSAGPVDAHRIEHVLGKEWKSCTGERTEEGVCRDGRGSAAATCQPELDATVEKSHLQHQICIHDIVECLQEDGQQTKTGQDARKGWYNPMDIGPVPRPSEPEYATGE
jgi:hypothetical protein